MKRIIPKMCVIHAIKITPKGAEVRFRCPDDHGQKEYRQGNTVSNYPSKIVRGIRVIELPHGISTSGSLHGFMHCKKDGSVLRCAGNSDSTNSKGLRGYRRHSKK